jgi:cell division protease FtsH
MTKEKIPKIPKIKQININKKNSYWSIIWLIIISLIITLLLPYIKDKETYIDTTIWLNQLELKYLEWQYKEILIDWNKAIAILSWSTIKEWNKLKTKRDIVILPKNDSISELWLKNPNIETQIIVKDKTSEEFWSEMLPTIIAFVLFFIIWIILIWRMGWVANNAMTFWKSRARLYDNSKDKILFKDVAWAEEEKEELSEVVQFLKNPKKFKDIWAKIPRWTLLVGPPGTGKTMLARAVAWESDVPFLSISGSEFVEMFVWVWASRVRDLFENAKKIAPAIIFIDEIDAIGKKRWPGTGWWHDEREQTLNQILTEMDWFNNDTNVIVIWATNRADVLDKALLRPGRFDRKITVNLPNLIDREQILKIHAITRKISNNIDFKSIASKTVWFAWADLWNLINEAAIISARNNEKEISEKRITEAFERLVMWLRKKTQVMNEDEKKITAIHEVWHAIVGKFLPNTDPVHKISIVSRWWALWVTWFLPERDKLLISKAKYLDELATLYWWRAAEEIFIWKDFITTWASNDIDKATHIAREMVMRYWMYEEIWRENFAGEKSSMNHLWVSEEKNISERAKEEIDLKVKEILDNAYITAISIITKYKDLHEKITKDLLEKEEINKIEFEKYFI